MAKPAVVSVGTVPEQTAVQPDLPPALDWTHNPWRLHPLKSAAALAICFGVAILAGWWMQAAGWSLIGFTLVAGTNSVLFLPVRYRLDAKGVTVWFLGAPSQRDWSHYRNAYFHPHLVHLTTLPKPSPLDPFRGHSLLFDPGNIQGQRESVRSFITRHVVLPRRDGQLQAEKP